MTFTNLVCIKEVTVEHWPDLTVNNERI